MAKARKKTGASGGAATVESPATTEGIPQNKKGEADKRYRYAPGTKPARESSGLPAGQARKQRMQELLGGKNWEYVEDGYDGDGILSVTGAKLKKFFVLRDTDSGETVTVGRGEMKVYAGVEPPKKVRGRSANGAVSEEFEEAFADGDDSAESTESTAIIEEDDLSFLDEPA